MRNTRMLLGDKRLRIYLYLSYSLVILNSVNHRDTDMEDLTVGLRIRVIATDLVATRERCFRYVLLRISRW